MRPSPRSLHRPALGAAVVIVALGAAVLTAPAAHAASAPDDAGTASATAGRDWAARASSAFDAMQANLWRGAADHGLYVENAPVLTGENPYSYLWTFREATEATMDVADVPGIGARYAGQVDARFQSLRLYAGTDAFGYPGFESYLPPPLGAGGDVFYDDNAIVGLSYFQRFTRSHDPADLTAARTQLDTVLRGWDTDPAAVCPGGLNWIASPSNTTRGANITGLGAQLAAHLYEQTRNPSDLAWATQLYDWNERCLKQSDGLYMNSRDDDGSLNPTLWTYNSGAMIGTATILYRATGDATWLQRATAAASASLDYWTAEDRLYAQPAIFNEMYFDDLLLLDSVQHDPRYRSTIATYAQRIWRANRDASTGLYRFGASGGGAPDPAVRVSTLEQAAVVQIMSALAWNRGDYHRIA